MFATLWNKMNDETALGVVLSFVAYVASMFLLTFALHFLGWAFVNFFNIRGDGTEMTCEFDGWGTSCEHY